MKDLKRLEGIKKNGGDKVYKICNYLEELKEEGKIKDYGWGRFQYWDGVMCITLNNEEDVFLAKTYFYIGSLGISTIKDLKNFSYIKQKINETIENGFYK